MSDEWEPHRRLLTVEEAAVIVGREKATIRSWVFRQLLVASAHTRAGQPLYLEIHVLQAEANVEASGRGRRRTTR